MTLSASPIDQDSIRFQLDRTASLIAQEYPAWQVEVTGEIDSTNGEARRRCEGDTRRVPYLLLALNQTAARGQHGRAWQSHAGKGLTFTAVIPFEKLARGHSGIGVPHDAYPLSLWPLLVGLGIALRLRLFGWHAELKWPNDVVISGKKIGGILCETANRHLIVGVGINLLQDPIDFDGAESFQTPPGSLAMAAVDARVEAILPAQTIPSLVQSVVTVLEAPWPEARMLNYYRDWCVTLGKNVTIRPPGGEVVEGVAHSILDDGRLLVKSADGKMTAVSGHLVEG